MTAPPAAMVFMNLLRFTLVQCPPRASAADSKGCKTMVIWGMNINLLRLEPIPELLDVSEAVHSGDR